MDQMMKAVRTEVTSIFIVLDLGEEDQFTVPSGITRKMTVTALNWEVRSNNSHPITAKAVDEDKVGWTLGLRWHDIPEPVQDALEASCFEGDKK